MIDNIEILHSEDVVELRDSSNQPINDLLNVIEIAYLFKVEDFIESLVEPLNIDEEAKIALREGIACRVMTTRQKGWIKGKVKLGLHFIPEIDDLPTAESKNPLDEIRNTSI
ncbi:KGK domain-containing protein [Pseudanabaena yagii]|uniref:Uncharacterized protein n=1 Tax=Pseudanabaena yagii GIHE-NHR1 TaxID=2722753 RepID=A0ABX1LPL5_9CYAN|nr:KGK domain-containing protein [Pseudanabaena yagii]NMF58068.1 hypothetical protein [Pseudanabaena yagii GIHE-NHR1]